MTADLVTESDLTRAVRTVLQDLKTEILENVSISVSAEYDDSAEDGLSIVCIAELPSLVITGPRLSENRFYSVNQIREFEQLGSPNQLVTLQGPPLTEDLQFSITGAANSATQLLNMMTAVSGFFNRNKWLVMPRDPDDPTSETVRWEMDFDADIRANLDGPDDIRAFTAGFPSAAEVLRYAFQVLFPAPAAAASFWQ